MSNEGPFQRRIAHGIEFVGQALPDRQVAALMLRLPIGAIKDPEDKLGLAGMTVETSAMATQDHDMLSLANAWDQIGAQRNQGAAVESVTYLATVLSEHLPRALGLLTEVIRRPSFPPEQVEIQRTLARQSLVAMEDSPRRKMSIELSRRAWGPMLGRHATGTPETLAAIGRDDLAQWYDTHFAAAGMQVTAAGAFDPDALQAELERLFEGFGNERPPAEAPEPTFAAGRHHIPKDCEQEALGISFGSLPPDDEDSYAEAVLLEILSGGMSGRLFTEVREKRGLAYWVFASRHWRRGHGRFRLAAGTRPERVHETLEVLLNEVGRLRDDVTEEELARAKTGLIAQMATRGDSTRSRAATIGMGYFYRGRVMSEDERRKRIEAVTTADVRRVLDRQNRDELCILTLGPRELD